MSFQAMQWLWCLTSKTTVYRYPKTLEYLSNIKAFSTYHCLIYGVVFSHRLTALGESFHEPKRLETINKQNTKVCRMVFFSRGQEGQSTAGKIIYLHTSRP